MKTTRLLSAISAGCILAAGCPVVSAETDAPETDAASAVSVSEVSTADTVWYGGVGYDSSITELDLSGRYLTIDGLEDLKAAVRQMPNLQKLVLCDCGLSNETLAGLREELPGVNVVWRIKLGSKWSLRTDAKAFSVLIYNYNYVRMTTADLEVLKYCTDLRALDLGHQAITDLTPLGEYLPELRLLILADNQISDLTPLTKMKHLHYLELFVNRLTDISPLAQMHELVDVNVSYNPITDLSPLLHSPMMSRLWFEHTGAGEATLAMLRQAYPNAKIVLYGTGSVDQGWRTHERYYQMMDMWFNDYYGDKFAYFDTLAQEMHLTAVRGDADEDGAVTLNDAMLTLLAYTAQTADRAGTLTDYQRQCADVDFDSAVSLRDAQLILQYYTANQVALMPVSWDELCNTAEEITPVTVIEVPEPPAEKTPEEPAAELPEEPIAENPEESDEETPEEPAEEISEEPAEEASEEPAEEISEEPTAEAPAEQADESAAETEEAPETAAEESAPESPEASAEETE